MRGANDFPFAHGPEESVVLTRFLAFCESETITLSTPLSWTTSFRFPLQCQAARREVLLGASWLLLAPGIGWLWNMGHRIEMVHRMHHGLSPWPASQPVGRILGNGLITFLGMLYYYSPAALAFYLGQGPWGWFLFAAATLAIPGYMTHYCRNFEVKEIFNPALALSRAIQGGLAYWHAWAIALSAMILSFGGLFFGLGFLVSSCWFWQVAGFSFASVFTNRYRLALAQGEAVD